MSGLLADLSGVGGKFKDFIFAWILDEQGEHTGCTCILMSSNNHLEVVVPYDSLSADAISWLDIGDDFDALDRMPSPPKYLPIKSVLDDSVFIVVEPKAIGKKLNKIGMTAPHGTIRLRPRYAVKGAPGIDYINVKKVRSVYPELLAWTNLSSIESTMEFDDSDPAILDSYNVGFAKRESVLICEKPFVTKFVPSASFSGEEGKLKGGVVVRQSVYLETDTDNCAPFFDQMEIHCAIRNLVSILAWRAVVFARILVSRDDDRKQYLDGSSRAAGFRAVYTDMYNTWKDSLESETRFIFRFEAVGVKGINRWLELDINHPKITNALYYLAANSGHLPIESQVIESGILLEEISDISSMNKDKSIEERVLQILQELEGYIVALPTFEKAKIARDIASTYNSLKHSKPSRRNKPREYWLNPVNLYDISVVCRAIFQIWLAKELGCKIDSLDCKPKDSSVTREAFLRIGQMDFDCG